MTPEDRRAAIIAATVPLLRAKGRAASTREIASAAGIAEGTIFRVFDNKDALIDAWKAGELAHLELGGALPAIAPPAADTSDTNNDEEN